MKVKVYVEGGGDSREQHIRCREGFRKLMEKAGFIGAMPGFVAGGGREQTFDRFKHACTATRQNEYPVLLVDSEDPLEVQGDSLGPESPVPWAHLKKRDGWTRPPHANHDQAQLMTTCMETWILADRDALVRFFGQHLDRNALLPLDKLEIRSRHKVQESLQKATARCGKGRGYKKGDRSFKVLAELEPDKLEQVLKHFVRFKRTLRRRLQGRDDR